MVLPVSPFQRQVRSTLAVSEPSTAATSGWRVLALIAATSAVAIWAGVLPGWMPTWTRSPPRYRLRVPAAVGAPDTVMLPADTTPSALSSRPMAQTSRNLLARRA
ncbi:hypothetical protein D9M69_584370 [compost metagenome]